MATGESHTPYELGATMKTMDSMVEKGLVKRVKTSGLGSSFSPRTTLTFTKI